MKEDDKKAAKKERRVDLAATKLLIEIVFLLPRGTNVNEHTVGKALVAYKEALRS